MWFTALHCSCNFFATFSGTGTDSMWQCIIKPSHSKECWRRTQQPTDRRICAHKIHVTAKISMRLVHWFMRSQNCSSSSFGSTYWITMGSYEKMWNCILEQIPLFVDTVHICKSATVVGYRLNVFWMWFDHVSNDRSDLGTRSVPWEGKTDKFDHGHCNAVFVLATWNRRTTQEIVITVNTWQTVAIEKWFLRTGKKDRLKCLGSFIAVVWGALNPLAFFVV